MAQLIKTKDSKRPYDTNLQRIIDRGIDDMEAGREMPLEEAFKKINELRKVRRN